MGWIWGKIEFYEKDNSIAGKMPAINGTIEPCADGRLLTHILVYLSAMQPSLLQRSVESLRL